MQHDDDARQLSREEIWVPPGLGPREWVRSNAYLDYRILKLAAPLAAVYALLVGAGMLLIFLRLPDFGMTIIVCAQGLWLVMLVVAFVRAREAWRHAGLRDNDEPPRHPHRIRHK